MRMGRADTVRQPAKWNTTSSRQTRWSDPHVRLLAAFVTACALLFALAGRAHAQDPQKKALAATLFEEATKAMQLGNYAEACPKLERVVELIPEGLGAKLELASCYEGANKLASAFGMYVTIEGEATRTNQPERAATARERMDKLKPRLATVTLDVAANVKAAPGFALKRDGVEVSAAEFGVSAAVDAGEHAVLATATGRAPWEVKFSVLNGDKKVIKVELGAEGGAAAPPPDPNNPPPPGGSQKKTESSFFSPLRIAGLAIGIGGLGVLGAGIGLGMNAKSLYDESNEVNGCDPEANTCPTQAGVDQRSDAVTFATASTALIVVGGVLAAGGIVMFAVAPSEEITVGLGPGSLTLTASF